MNTKALMQASARLLGLQPLGLPSSAIASVLERISSGAACSTSSASASATAVQHAAAGDIAASPGTTESVAKEDPMLRALLTPLPLSRVRNSGLSHEALQLGDMMFLNPEKTLASVMRTLFVIKQVLRDDQHVYIVNSNPQFTPLMREASLRCTNPNVWWYWSSWQPGMLSRPGSLLVRDHQPVARLLSSRGLKMVNVHAQHSAQGAAAVSASPTGTSTSAGVSSRGSSSVGSSSNVGSTSSPSSSSSSSPSTSSLRLDALDTWRLWGRRRQRGFRGGPPEPHGKDVLRGVLAAEVAAARLPIPGALPPGNNRLGLVINLDLSHGVGAVSEAYNQGVLTASVVNAHSPLDSITYPIYAGEAHPAFTHFLLDWVLKVVNLPPPPPKASSSASLS